MDKELLKRANEIVKENTDDLIPKEIIICSSSEGDYYKNIKKNIDVYLARAKSISEKIRCLESAIEGSFFFGKNRRAYKLKIKSFQAPLETIRKQLERWWLTYENNAPISVKVGNTSIGECVCFGLYECFVENYRNVKSKISWKVITKQNGRALLISNCVLDVVAYSFQQNGGWQTSGLRKWCQELYEKHFTNAEKQYILTTSVRTPDNENGYITADKIFCLSGREIKTYMPNTSARFTRLTQVADSRHITAWDCYAESVPRSRRLDGWWTRSLGKNQDSACCVLDHFTTEYRANTLGIPITESRAIYNDAFKKCPLGVRPAMWVKVE